MSGMTDDEYRRYVQEAIRAGLEDFKNGRWIEHEEFEKRMSRWLRDDEDDTCLTSKA
jgi:predicted transcriptional regulator